MEVSPSSRANEYVAAQRAAAAARRGATRQVIDAAARLGNRACDPPARGPSEGLAQRARRARISRMTGDQILAWAILLFGFVLPLAHVAASRLSGPWAPPPGSKCPFGPRVGWLVIVLVLGPLGWLLYMRRRGG
jgi:hypothetical protein